MLSIKELPIAVSQFTPMLPDRSGEKPASRPRRFAPDAITRSPVNSELKKAQEPETVIPDIGVFHMKSTSIPAVVSSPALVVSNAKIAGSKFCTC